MSQAKCYECADQPSFVCDRCRSLMCQNHYKPTNDLNPEGEQDVTICLSCYGLWQAVLRRLFAIFAKEPNFRIEDLVLPT